MTPENARFDQSNLGNCRIHIISRIHTAHKNSFFFPQEIAHEDVVENNINNHNKFIQCTEMSLQFTLCTVCISSLRAYTNQILIGEAFFVYDDITDCWFLPNSRYWEGDMGLGPPNQSIKNMFSISNLKILKSWFFGQSFISGCLVKSADLAKSASDDCRSTNFNFPVRVSFEQVGFSGSIFPHVPRGNSLRVKEVLSSSSASLAVGSRVVR